MTDLNRRAATDLCIKNIGLKLVHLNDIWTPGLQLFQEEEIYCQKMDFRELNAVRKMLLKQQEMSLRQSLKCRILESSLDVLYNL